MTIRITEGMDIEVRDAWGQWHPSIAMSDVEGTHEDGHKIHDFPVIWVRRYNDRGGMERVPWPVEDVRPRGHTA